MHDHKVYAHPFLQKYYNVDIGGYLYFNVQVRVFGQCGILTRKILLWPGFSVWCGRGGGGGGD